MQFIEHELSRIHHALTSDERPEGYDQLYAAQQALAWTLDPATFTAPSQMLVIDIREGSAGCREEIYRSQFSDTRAYRVSEPSPRQISPVQSPNSNAGLV